MFNYWTEAAPVATTEHQYRVVVKDRNTAMTHLDPSSRCIMVENRRGDVVILFTSLEEAISFCLSGGFSP